MRKRIGLVEITMIAALDAGRARARRPHQPVKFITYPIGYGRTVYEIRRSTAFDTWLTNLSDSNARARIAARIDRLALGNPGDVKPVGGGVSELRIDYGPGYRVYYARTDRVVYLLLCGGTKATQDVDIKRAIEMTAARAREVSAALQRKPKKRK
jgi:putative addiction module killer protein